VEDRISKLEGKVYIIEKSDEYTEKNNEELLVEYAKLCNSIK
jgi:hypothetical protein